MSLSEIPTIDLFATPRPIKTALILDVDHLTTDFLIESVIPFLLSHWGGTNDFIIPVGDDNVDHFWLELLSKFDPDKIVSTTNTSTKLKQKILNRCITEDFFEHNIGIPRPCLGHRSHLGRTKIENIFDTSIKTIQPPFEYNLTFDPLLDLWFSSIFGRYRNISKDLGRRSIVKPLQRTDVYSKAIKLSNLQFNPEHSPVLSSLSHLGFRGIHDHFHKSTAANIIVLGDTFEDWTLFWNLRALYNFVHWVPASLLNYEQDYPDKMDYFLENLLSLYCYNNSISPPKVVSRSLSEHDAKNIIDSTIKRINLSIGTQKTPAYDFKSDIDKFLSNWLVWAEYDNVRETCSLLSNGKTLQAVPTNRPKNLSAKPGQISFFVEVSSDQHRFLAHPFCKSDPCIWKNPRAITKKDSRRNKEGGVVYWGTQHLIMGERDMDSLLHSPRIKLISLFNQFSEIVSFKNCFAEETPGTNTIRLVQALWDGNLDNFIEDIFSEDFARIFATYKRNFDRSKRVEIAGVDESAGLHFKRRFFFSLLKNELFDPHLTSLTDTKVDKWLKNQILIRGEKLLCNYCGQSDFYSESDTGHSYTCKWCNNKNFKGIKAMKSVEPKFIYDLNPLVYSLFTSNSHIIFKTAAELKKRARTFFDWTGEIRIGNEDNPSVFEIDLVANVDGNLVLGECKSNNKVDLAQLKRYRHFMKRHQINHLILGSESGWNGDNQKNVRGLFSSNPEVQIDFY